MELFEHPLHVVVQLAVFAILHKRGPKQSRVFAISHICLIILLLSSLFCKWFGAPHRFLMIPCPPGKMTASKLLASSVDRSCICIFPWPWLKRADSIIMFLFDGQTQSETPPCRKCQVTPISWAQSVWFLPILARGRLLFYVVHHLHLLLIGSKHLEASSVSAQVVHGAEEQRSHLPY